MFDVEIKNLKVFANIGITSDERKKAIFDFIANLLQKSGKIGEYDQKI